MSSIFSKRTSNLFGPTIEPEGIGESVFDIKYSYPGENGWKDRANSIGRLAASCEDPDKMEKFKITFSNAIKAADLVPAGRIIYGAGRPAQNLLNCYHLCPDDSVDSIGKTISDMYKISCAGGGVGFNFSNIRPKGDDISTIKNSAPGSVSVMKMINEIAEHVRSGKNRRVALLAGLDVSHPDILEFLHVKLDLSQLNNFNISVNITDDFIEACKYDLDWTFKYNNRIYRVFTMDRITPVLDEEGNPTEEVDIETINVVGLSLEDAQERADQHYRLHYADTFENAQETSMKAMWLFSKIWENAVESGCPGILNLSNLQRHTNVSYFETLTGVNPCGEANLPNYGNCCLASVNLSNMVKEDQTFDWQRFAYTVRTGVRFLDNILTVNHFPLPECREVGHRSRRIGLGVLGYHHMLLKLGLRYGSEKCLEFTERLAATFRDEAYSQSMLLSKEKGPFPAFDSEKFLAQGFAKTLPHRIRHKIKRNGIRNAIVMSIAPTGSIGMVVGASTGIEPIFAPIYKRRYRKADTWHEEVVLDPLFKKFVEAGLDLDHFVGAYDVTPEEHLAVQAAWQACIDQSMSKTINLPEEAEAKDLIDIALQYSTDLKGMTIYRAGSKPNEPLVAIPTTAENIKKYSNQEQDTEEVAAFCSLEDGTCGDV